MNLEQIKRKIHEYFLESEKEGLVEKNLRTRGNYPNAILLTKQQYISLLKEMFKLDEDVEDTILLSIKILSIEGLEVVFTDSIEEPKVIKYTKE